MTNNIDPNTVDGTNINIDEAAHGKLTRTPIDPTVVGADTVKADDLAHRDDLQEDVVRSHDDIRAEDRPMNTEATYNDGDANGQGIDPEAVKHMSKETQADLNADGSGNIGSHPVGTAVGGVGGAIAGAAIGSIAGPLGTLIGGAIGALAGSGAGHASAEGINPTLEDEYWRAQHAKTDYFKQDAGHEYNRDYQPAYAVGYANRHRYDAGARFEDHEADLKRSWEEVKGESRLNWEEARDASRDAWNRVDY